jgi:hypothetical protein
MSMAEFKQIGEVEMDARGRVSFGRVGKKGQARYLVEEGPTGELHLIPLISVPVRGIPPWNTKAEFEESLDESLEQVKNGETVSLGDFSQFADDNTD